MERLSKNEKFLRKLKRGPKEERKKLLEKCTPDQVKVICDICYNILEGEVKLKDWQQKKLFKSADTIRTLGRKGKTSLSKKKQVLVQQGEGFITALLVPIISGLIGGLVRG